jgi:uridine kinase
MERLGGEEAARDLYARRYHPAYTLYERLSEPERHSDAIIDNDYLTRPQLHVRAQSRLA